MAQRWARESRDATESLRYLSLSEIHSFSFRTLRASSGEGWRRRMRRRRRMAIEGERKVVGEWCGSARGGQERREASAAPPAARVLPRANDIVTITVTTYSCAEWWRVTACFDSAKPRGSKIHWSGGCDPAVSMLPLARYARGLATVTLPPLAPPLHLCEDPPREGPITTHHGPLRNLSVDNRS